MKIDSFICYFFAFGVLCSSTDVTLTSGLQNFDRVQLDHQYNLFALYKNMHIINSASMLIYNIDMHGNLDTYKTNDSSTSAEYFQSLLKTELHLKAYPCLYCDATSGFCTDLNMRLEKMFKNQTRFTLSLVDKIMEMGWEGFYFDFEPDGKIDWSKLTNFLIEVSNVLHMLRVQVYVWFGRGTPYDDRIFSAQNIQLVSMDTYVDTYIDFVTTATNNLELLDNANKLGVGLLTSEAMSEKDMDKVRKWCQTVNITTINVYASTISGVSFKPLHQFLAGV